MKYEVSVFSRFLNAECRFFFFFFFLREGTDKNHPNKLKRRDLKNNT